MNYGKAPNYFLEIEEDLCSVIQELFALFVNFNVGKFLSEDCGVPTAFRRWVVSAFICLELVYTLM